MWIIWTLVGFAVLAYLGYAWIVALVTKYQHTSDSLAVFAVLVAISVFLGINVANQVAPGWTLGPKSAIVLGIAFTLFTLFSFIVVNVWCSLLTRKFDDKVSTLEEEEDSILRRLDSSRWKAIRQAEHPAYAEHTSAQAKFDEERAALTRTVELWEQGGGAARIRSMKALEWRESITGKSLEVLQEDLRNVDMEARNDPDDSRREQARAHAALISLEILAREGPPVKVPEPAQSPRLPEDEGKARERLQAIQGEIEGQRKAKAEFMRQRIRLSWRAAK